MDRPDCWTSSSRPTTSATIRLGTTTAPKGMRIAVAEYRAAFPDLRVTVDDLVTEGDKVVSSIHASRAHTRGPFLGIPPTGRAVTAAGVAIDRVANGKVAESWVSLDALNLLRQLGARPVRSATRRPRAAGHRFAIARCRHRVAHSKENDMSAITAVGALTEERAGVRDAAVRQLSRAQIFGVWAAAAVPMGVLSWVIAPWFGDRLGGAEPLAQALLILITAGLVWQGLLVLILTRRELGTLQWARVRDALWLRAPRDPRTGRAGGRVWLWTLPCAFLLVLEELLPGFAGPLSRDFAAFLGDDRGQAFFQGAWGWFAVVVVFAVFNTALGEELLFRGYLLPRMRGAFGRWDWVANGVLFAAYHLHVPWVILPSLIDTLALAYPSRRFRSAWMGIVVHSTQSLVVLGVVLAAVLG